MDRRREARTKKRIACALLIKGVRQHGIVMDVSSKGLFVQTSAKPKPGDEVRIELTLPGQSKPTLLHATVARVRMVPPALLAVAQGGIGVEIQNPPEEYFVFVGKVAHIGEEQKQKPKAGIG
jgi:Tfp pilus assembly protein PilZ